VVRRPINEGVGAALRAGFKEARAGGAGIIVVLGGDDQDNPEEIPRLLAPLKDGKDFVQGSRWRTGGRTENINLFRWMTTRMYSVFFRWCTGFPCTDGTNGFRAFRADILDRIDLEAVWLNAYELEPYLFYHAVRNFKAVEVPVTKRYPLHKGGYTKMVPFKSWWSILRPLILLRLGVKK
jgi:dolichol-phosphate mannosyltransferase